MKILLRVLVAIAITATLAVSALETLATGSVHSTLPRSLVGQWHRKIVVDLRKPGAPIIPSGTWHLTIRSNGAVRVVDAERFTFSGSLAVVSNGIVVKVDICQTGFAAASKNLYRWTVVGPRLTFKLVRDSECSDRIAVFKGTWLKG